MSSRSVLNAVGAIILLALASLLGSSDAAVAAPKRPAAVHVYLFRGLMNIWSLGLDDLAREIRRPGIQVTVVNHMAVHSVAAQAIADYRTRRTSHVVFIGHSWGSDAALHAAQTLNDAKVPVDLVVTYDATSNSVAPANVRKVVNFYVSSGLGHAIAPSRHFGGVLQNIDESKDAEIGHFNIEKNAALHRKVTQLILSVTESP